MPMIDSQGRRERVVIVGGTSGIGRATAHRLGADGAEIVVASRDPIRVARACAELTSAGVHAAGLAVDATDDAALDAFFARIGSFDHLVLTLSGAAGAGAFPTLDLAEVRRGFEAKFWPQLSAAQRSLTALRSDGSITFVTAISARLSTPGIAGLAAINGALESLVRPLASELRPRRVNAVSPGVIDTPWWDGLQADQRAAAFAAFASSSAAGRVGTAAEVASAVALVVTNAFITGTVIEVDGGLRLG